MSDYVEGEAERAPITDEPAVRALVERLARAPVLGLDTEGDGMFRYRAQLCLVQLSSASELAVVDTLALSPRLLAPLLEASGPEKVVHDAAFDARLLAVHGVWLGGVFDTAIAARFLGFRATGLASLLAQLFDVKLPKHMQQADWGARPLGTQAIAYLENDVRYLLALHEALLERVRQADIEPEVREECAYMLSEAHAAEVESSPFARVKGAHARPPRERAAIYELALVRDALARAVDLPPTRVLTNDQLLRVAELAPTTRELLERALPPPVRGQVERFEEALARAALRADAPADELASLAHELPSRGELERRKRRRELLAGFREREATVRGVDPQVVLPGHCLADMVKLPGLSEPLLGAVPGLGSCRIERYAERWASELGPRWT